VKLSTAKDVRSLLGYATNRYALDTAKLEIEDGKGTLVVTDGRALAILPVELSPGDEPGLIPGEAFGQLEEEVDEDGFEYPTDREFIVSNGCAKIVRDEKNAPTEFPNWRAVVPAPDAPAAVEFAICPRLLHMLARAMGTNGVRLRVPLPGADGQVRSPIRVDGPGGAVGSIMPMLNDDLEELRRG
jgi:hypothetical protein